MAPSLLALFLALAEPAADPLAPAWAGHVACVAPDAARRECAVISSYRRGADGKIWSDVTVGVSAAQQIVMSLVDGVWIADDAVCSVIGLDDLASSSFTIAGAPATATQTAALRDQVMASRKDLFGRQVCTTHPPMGAASMGEVRIDGVRTPQEDQPMAWVLAGAGYTVRPR